MEYGYRSFTIDAPIFQASRISKALPLTRTAKCEKSGHAKKGIAIKT
jgi:hypothetical protein